uniref:Beta-1,4-glucuronyltransferase 1 n=1 Tax=Cacopsylla melanoneura TaxID=428564 RepID=A0A8D8PPZ8_9HEMI
MFTRRNWVLRSSIVINLLVLAYFGTCIVFQNGTLSFIREMQKSGRSLANLELAAQSGGSTSNDLLQENMEIAGGGPFSSSANDLVSSQSLVNPQSSVETNSPRGTTVINSVQSFVDHRFVQKVSTTSDNSLDSDLVSPNSNINNSTSDQFKSKPSLQDVIKCNDVNPYFSTAQRGDYWVLYNYILAERKFHCWESITYTSHADYTFLDNLVPLLERWQGPISIALYTPGTDFDNTLKVIKYLRECTTPLITELVTFHLYFPARHVPKHIPKPSEVFKSPTNCSILPPWSNTTASSTYKSQKKMLYPVNVGRNIARQTAATHYILASDIELYPSPGVITDFLDMVQRQDPPLLHKKPKVFPLSIFEVESNMNLPGDKTELVAMLKNGSAIPFHKKVCAGCHNVPKSKEWMKQQGTPGLHVFHIGKRMGYFVHWEPIYIGTHQDPYYDERLSWEGKSDKMTQGYTLCVMDYEFQILDNAFLVHKPGIKTLKKDHARAVLAGKTNAMIRKVIAPELRILYGIRKGCAI